MTTLLVVAEAKNDQQEIEALIGQRPEWSPIFADSTDDALKQVHEKNVDLILVELGTHRHQPELVADLREHLPRTPILVISPDDDHHALVQALMLGGASYIPRGRLAQELVGTMERLLALCGRPSRRQLADCIQHESCRMSIPAKLDLLPVVVGYLRDCAETFGFRDEHELIRLAVALEEALNNALIHGNLEIGSELRGVDDEAYRALIEERRNKPPFCNRTISVEATFDNREVTVAIADEGPGFDPDSLPDPTDPENLIKPYGRGMMLMRSFMDHVEHNDRGNRITLIKRFPEPEPATSP